MASRQPDSVAWRPEHIDITDRTASALDAYWRCANYLSIGQIYLRSNPLLRRPLAFGDVKPRPVGHWGTIPGLNFLYAHINRLVADHAQRALVVIGPGHGGNAGAVSALVDGSYTERYPDVAPTVDGLTAFMRSYAAPGGMPSNCTPAIPGSIHSGGELGYTLSHAFGAAFDNPDQLIVPIVGDGESEEGAIASAWSMSRIMNPTTDGIVLPILHLNGYKITMPSLIAAATPDERAMYFRSLGYDPVTFTVGFDDEDPLSFHRRFAELLEDVYARICAIKEDAAARGPVAPADSPVAPAYPLIIFQSPKGWTTPAGPDGTPFEDTTSIHEVPLRIGNDPERLAWLESWLRSYRPDELFDERGGFAPEVRAIMPTGDLRLGVNPIADGGRARRSLVLPDPADWAPLISDRTRGLRSMGLAGICGAYTREVMRDNPDNFRLFSPDELSSNRMDASLEVTGKQWNAGGIERDDVASALDADDPSDLDLVPSGKVVEVLSEHQCEGMLEGYILTGRHGIWATYEAFAQVASSMVTQHLKWLEESAAGAPWRAPLSSLNILLTSHVWRQDHNGFTHQDPGFADVLINKAGPLDVARVYYPADANMMLAVMERCYASTARVNAIVAGKHESPVYLTIDEAKAELSQGAAVWKWASTDGGERPDLVVASAGDVVTVEALAAAQIMQEQGVRVRFVNVVDLLRLAVPGDAADALEEGEFESLFPVDVPVLFCFHGYEGQVLRLLARRRAIGRFNVHGFRNQGSTTTPFGMLYANGMDRFALAASGLQLVSRERFAAACEQLSQNRDELWAYSVEHGIDHPSLGLM